MVCRLWGVEIDWDKRMTTGLCRNLDPTGISNLRHTETLALEKFLEALNLNKKPEIPLKQQP